MKQASDRQPSKLSFGDTLSLIFGIVVGVSIFSVPPSVFAGSGGTLAAIGIWLLGGLLALCGALCYGELAAMYPEFGAEYLYLSKGFGRRIGFVYAWMQMTVILTGSIGVMSFAFADYAGHAIPSIESFSGLLAAGAIAIPGAWQFLGLRTGKLAQNVLSFGKLLSLAVILVCGVMFVPSHVATSELPEATNSWMTPGLAFVFVLYAYGGWSDVAMVTPEVHDCRRTMPRALLFGLGGITVLYILLNIAYVRVLGYDGLIRSSAPAADVVSRTWGVSSGWIMSGMVMLSALGAINGMLFAGCRLLVAVGRDYPRFRSWTEWSRSQTPFLALVSLLGISLIMVLVVGTPSGRDGVDAVYRWCGLFTPDWEKYGRGFDTLVAATAPIFWGFFTLSGMAVIVLRMTRPELERPFHVPLYPVTPLIFIASSVYMLWSSLDYARQLTVLMLPFLVIGCLLAFILKYSPDGSDASPRIADLPAAESSDQNP
ncbi:MAG: amino acid permease [Planctomycetaceae bacterium]|nr:amino acid permease [Planctomycetaceae bacterium]